MEKKTFELGRVMSILAFLFVIICCGGFNTIVAAAIAGMFIVSVLKGEDQKYSLAILEAGYLLAFNGIVRLVVGGFEDIIGQIIDWADGNRYGAFADVFQILGFVITLFFLALAVLAFVNILSKKASNTICVSGLAAKSLGIFIPKPQPVYQQPVYPQPIYQQPAPAPTDTWTCACGRQNNGPFCSACGKPRQQ